MITSFNHLTLAIKDIHKSFAFYKEVLGFKPLCKWDKGAYFLVGDLWFCLNVDQRRMLNPCYTHYAFTIAPESFALMQQRLMNYGVQVFKDNTSPGESFYFLDPDGHKLELHVGNWQSRVVAKKENLGTWQEVEWFV